MSRRNLFAFLKRITPPPDCVSDAALLRRYVGENDHAAFELILRRHADVVWSVCRGTLRDEADAEDAFQATFVALAKSAQRIRIDSSLAGWLYRVAVNAALKLRESKRETNQPLTEHIDQRLVEADESHGILIQELAKLKENERLPLLLCDWEGQTRDEAAANLGWPVGTVNGRLCRARSHLRERLLRRGFVAPATIVCSTVPATLSARATSTALGLNGIPESISLLAQGAITAMTATNFKLTAGLAAGMMLALGMGTMVAMGQQNGTPNASTLKPDSIMTASNEKPKVPQAVKIPSKLALKDQWSKDLFESYTIYPELISVDLTQSLAKRSPQILGMRWDPPVIDAKDGPAFLSRESLITQFRVLMLCSKVFESGQWDVATLNNAIQMVSNTEHLIRKLPKQDRVALLKELLFFSSYIETIVIDRVNIGNLRQQQYFETRSSRYAMELALYQAESNP
jgi:RNA polymerase sigma factor (sigma-70 family)